MTYQCLLFVSVLGIKTNEILIKGKMREDKLKMESAISQERTQQCSTAFQKLVILCAKKITFCTLFFFLFPSIFLGLSCKLASTETTNLAQYLFLEIRFDFYLERVELLVPTYLVDW